MVGYMALEGRSTGGSEARKMVADWVKAEGDALRDRKAGLNLHLDNGRRHGVYVSEYVMFQRCQCVLYVCVCFCV